MTHSFIRSSMIFVMTTPRTCACPLTRSLRCILQAIYDQINCRKAMRQWQWVVVQLGRQIRACQILMLSSNRRWDAVMYKRVWFRWLDLVKDLWIAEARAVGMVRNLRVVNLRRRWAQWHRNAIDLEESKERLTKGRPVAVLLYPLR